MKTLYEAANAVEAHMLIDLLRQDGLTAYIHGEHLQGAIGELPAAGLVRLVIDEQDHARARALIERWEAQQPASAPAPAASARPRRTLWLLAGVLIGGGLVHALARTPVTTEGIDYNRDGVLDETWIYAPRGTPVRMESDRNLDGKVDYVANYDERGLIESAEADDNFDGRFETRLSFWRGNVEQVQVDTDGDGVVDLVSASRHGVLTQTEYLHPTTHRALKVEHFSLGKLTTAELDADADGELDTQISYNALGEVSSRRPYTPRP